LDLQAYAARLAIHLAPSPLAFVHAAALIDRLAAAHPPAAPAADTVHRLLLAAVTVGVKMTDDACASASFVARVGGVPRAELASLELALLRGVGFAAHVRYDELAARLAGLRGAAPPAAA
jgi:hypothetical protein